MLGKDRVVDVRCINSGDASVTPVGRATSGALNFETGSDGVAGLVLSVVLGPVGGFVNTTTTGVGAKQEGTCDALTQSGGRFGHTATLLDDGRVLIVGGIHRLGTVAKTEEILNTAEIFDPRTGEHRLLLGQDGFALSMQAKSGRAYHTAVKLRNGKVLIAGGVAVLNAGARSALASSELFDPMSESFTGVATMGNPPQGRAHHTLTTLASGKVLLVGGASYYNGQINSYYNSALLYDPESNSWQTISNAMSTGRAFHQAVLLDPASAGGKVLIIGGDNDSGPTNSTDIFNPDDSTFYANVNVNMKKNRSHHCAVRLDNGKVLVAGGITTTGGQPETSVEFYKTGGSFGEFEATVVDMTVARMDTTCTLLETKNVLIAGGLTGNQATGIADIILIGDGTYPVTPALTQLNPPRYLHTATMLDNGWVLLDGGLPNADASSDALTSSTLFVPPPAKD
jgi:hypothetical protein